MTDIAGKALVVAVLVLASGCGLQSEDPVAARAQRFYDAVDSGDAPAACADLAPEARTALEQQEGEVCEDVILNQDLPRVTGRGGVLVHGSAAQVTHRGETAFLSRFDSGWRLTAVGAFNETRLGRLRDPLSWTPYVANADFWSRTLQNWQSEFLAVGSMAVLAIYLRQRGSSGTHAPRVEARDSEWLEVSCVARDDRHPGGLGDGGDEGVVERRMLRHPVRGQDPSGCQIERQNPIHEGRQDALVEPAAQDLALSGV